MLSLLVFTALISPAIEIPRDSFGIAHISASNLNEAFRNSGYAVAMDRLWQMENSRRLARGQMSEAFGDKFLASDKEVLATAYTDSELKTQFDKLSEESRMIFRSYAEGVNLAIQDRKRANQLPSGYAENGFAPRAWDVLDSVAISIRLFQMFGQGGGGEMRNMAMLMYLQSRPNKAQALDIFDDFLWENSPNAPTTVESNDDHRKASASLFPKRTRAITEAHIASMPKLTLMDVLPSIRLAQRETSTLVAESLNVPYKVGSYAIVVDGKHSKTGYPLLLSAPQMGHTMPSVVHEISISCPEYSAVGMDVPGVPGIAIGHSKTAAWGMTSGVMDTTDVFFSKLDGTDKYIYGTESRPLQKFSWHLKSKSGKETEVVQNRTHFGPVILNTKGYAFSQKSSWWMREMESFESVRLIAKASTPQNIDDALRPATVSFNFFYALQAGKIGYRYLGAAPIRATGLDHRFPIPGEPKNNWRGMFAYSQMPAVRAPESGVISNWNNKPVAWWPNVDTPVWGRTFRLEALRKALPKDSIGISDLEMAAWWIARLEPTYMQTMPLIRPQLASMLAQLRNPKPNVRVNGRFVEALEVLLAFDGRNLDGSPGAFLYSAFFRALREELFIETTGTFLSEATFRTVAQPSVILEALEGKTKVDYRQKRSTGDVVAASFNRMFEKLDEPSKWRFVASGIQFAGQDKIPYIDRGTYIQVVELPPSGVRGRNIVSPGVAELGAHSTDQISLSRSWLYKTMGW